MVKCSSSFCVNAIQIEAFIPGFGLKTNLPGASHECLLHVKPNNNSGNDLDVSSRRKVIFGLIAAIGSSTFVPNSANAVASKKISEEVKPTASTSSSSAVASAVVGPNIVPLAILSTGAISIVSGKALSKSEESSSSSLYVEAVPYGMREGRNYWNGIDLAAASAASTASITSESNTTTPKSHLKQQVPESKEGKNSKFTGDISSAFFIKTTEEKSTESKYQAASRPKQPSTASLKDLLNNDSNANVVASKSDKDIAEGSIDQDNIAGTSIKISPAKDALSDDELLVLEAQREAEEAELLLREAEAEAARIDQELAKLGISTTLLPLVGDEVESSKEETPYWREIEVKLLRSGKNISSINDEPIAKTKTSTSIASKVTALDTKADAQVKKPNAAAEPITPKTSPVPFSKLAQAIPPVSRVNRTPPKSINNSLAYLASLPSNTKPKPTTQAPVSRVEQNSGQESRSIIVPKPANKFPGKKKTGLPKTNRAAADEVISVSKSVNDRPKSAREALSKTTKATPGSDKAPKDINKSKTVAASFPVQAAAVPFSKIALTIPPVSRGTAAKAIDATSSKPVTRTTNLKELLNTKK